MKKIHSASNYTRLTPAPRHIPEHLRSTISRGQFRLIDGSAYLVVIGSIASGIYLAIGIGNPASIMRAFGLGLIIFGFGLSKWITGRKRKRFMNWIDTMANGTLHHGLIVNAFDKAKGEYRPISDLQKDWKSAAITSWTGSALRRWPVQITIHAVNTSDDPMLTKLVDTKIDLTPWLRDLNGSNNIHLLLPQSGIPKDAIILENEPWLTVDQDGHFAAAKESENLKTFNRDLASSLIKALLVVIPTYALAIYGVVTTSNHDFQSASIPPLVSAMVTLLFTLTHGVVPIFFYRLFLGGLEGSSQKGSRKPDGIMIVTGFITLHMTIWYGAPIIGLAAMTNWYSLAWVALHILFAGKHRRQWTFLEHGSTSVALILFMTTFSGSDLFPTGIIVVLLQSLLLTIAEWRGKSLWTRAPEQAV